MNTNLTAVKFNVASRGGVRSRHLPIAWGPTLKSGTPVIAGFISAGALIPENFKIPYRDSLKKTGYQRPPQTVRINELAQDLEKRRVDLPTAVLLNIRDQSVLQAMQYDDNGCARLDMEWFSHQGRARSAGAYFFVVDGQHRILALQRLIENDPTGDWQDFQIPFVCMLGADEDEEMDQFYTVNSKAKSVRTDLAFELLKERADKNQDVYDSLIERGREWQVDGSNIAQRLLEASPVWQNRVRLPSMDKGTTTINNASLVTSLKSPLNDSPLFKRSSLDQRVKILDAYWRGIKAALPEAFSDPTKYSIQKGLGVIIMHEVMPDVIEIVRSRGGSVTEEDDYAAVLRGALDKLEGDNGRGDLVKGADFWHASSEGAAGSFSSGAGRRVLAAKVRQLLPDIDIE